MAWHGCHTMARNCVLWWGRAEDFPGYQVCHHLIRLQLLIGCSSSCQWSHPSSCINQPSGIPCQSCVQTVVIEQAFVRCASRLRCYCTECWSCTEAVLVLQRLFVKCSRPRLCGCCVAEQLVGEKCTEKADIYSLGVVLWELCTLDTPMLRQTRDIM